MKPPTTRQIIIFVACTLLFLFPVEATSIEMVPSTVTLQKGATVEINLVLDDAPSGLAGYDLGIRLSNPGIAEISGITYPSWAALYNTTRKVDGSVRISGVDLYQQVNPGMTAIPLATIWIGGISGGWSSVSLESLDMDDDGGSFITPALPTGQILVPGGSVATSGGDGGGGGNYVSPMTPSITSPTPTISRTPTTSPTIPIVQSTPIQSPAFNAGTSPQVTTQINEPLQTGASTNIELPEENKEIPWLWILGGIIVIVLGVLILGAFIVWRREQD